MLKKILTPVASLRLTVVLLALSLVMVFFGTLAQRHYNINHVENKYFHSFIAWVDLKDLLPPNPAGKPFPGSIPLPGGFGLGALLLLNLVAAHSLRFKLSLKRSGIILIHFSLILLLVGEAIRATKSIETRMVIDEGTYANHTFSLSRQELAIIERGEKDDTVVVVPSSRLKKAFADKTTIDDSNLPVQVKVDYYAENSDIVNARNAGNDTKALATAGDNRQFAIRSLPKATGVEGGSVDVPSAFVTFANGAENLGTYLLTANSEATQQLKVGDKTYDVVLRFERTYKPFQIHLDDFTFDRYPGTDTPLNFSSSVRLIDPTQSENRPVRIWMNHPLRYGGETYFQADWNKQTERGTVLQVVRNPGWVIPYVACILGGIGLLVHFGIVLMNFINKDAKMPVAKTPAKGGKPGRPDQYTLDPRPIWMRPAGWLPIVVVTIFALYVGSRARPPEYDSKYDLATFGKLVISYEGRVQPLDSVARNSLLVWNGRDYYEDKAGEKRPAIEMLLKAFANDASIRDEKLFKIHLADVLDFFKLDPAQKRYSVNELIPSDAAYDAFRRQVAQAFNVAPKQRNLYQNSMIELWTHLNTFFSFSVLEPLYLVAPEKAGEKWRKVGDGAEEYRASGKMPRSLTALVDMRKAYQEGNAAEFNKQARVYHNFLEKSVATDATRSSFERWTNHFKADKQSAMLYVTVFVLAALSWLGGRETLQRTAFWLLAFTALVHTFAIVARIYISGRPPVTNLESSAIFIGWGAVLMAMGVERFYKNSIATAVGAAIGAITILIYLMLLKDKGDSMKVLQAVLDTNFWLATHVVCITLGYSATFLAGMMGLVWIGGGLFTSQLGGDNAKRLTRMIYGVTCFAILFSFIGTVLGGIWADQSWGRFWGWDPKENGAIMIVLANALLLHARWGGMAQGRGIAMWAVFGNIVTAWSWFGTNMLGVGLHSYGFMEAAYNILMAFIGSQVVLLGLACIPQRIWPSFRDEYGTTARRGFPVGKQ
jgi:ABC-type transport system involved in cytochrome c biogenesis permease subunit